MKTPPASDCAADALEPDGEWNAYLQAMSGFLTGVGLERILIADYVAYEAASTGCNWRAPAGYGSLVAASLPRPIDLRLSTPVESIELDSQAVVWRRRLAPFAHVLLSQRPRHSRKGLHRPFRRPRHARRRATLAEIYSAIRSSHTSCLKSAPTSECLARQSRAFSSPTGVRSFVPAPASPRRRNRRATGKRQDVVYQKPLILRLAQQGPRRRAR